MVRVYKCVVSGDEMISDSYPMTPCYEDACMEVQARMVKKGSDQIAIASDDIIEEDDDCPQVIDIVDSFQLNEITFTKKDFAAWAKGYLPKVVAHLEKTGKADRVADYKKGATAAIKFIMSKADEMQFFCGQKYDMDGNVCVCYNKEDEIEPTFIYFVDGMKIEKF
jgi:hypothetical protein